MLPLPERSDNGTKRRRTRANSIIAAATIAIVVAGTAAALAASDHYSPQVQGGHAAAYVPPDGYAGWAVDNTGVEQITENSRSVGYQDILLLPSKAASTVMGELGDQGARVAQLWRDSSTVATSGTLLQVSDLNQLSATGVSLLATFGGNVGFTYSPALLELPANVAPGVSWSSSGSALPQALATYTAHYTASAPKNAKLLAASKLTASALKGCLQTDGGSTYVDSKGSLFLNITEADLWCKGEGRMAIVATLNGTEVIQGPPAKDPVISPVHNEEMPAHWSGISEWKPATVNTGFHDAFFGDQELTLALNVSPIRTASGLFVAANLDGNDVTGLTMESGKLQRKWFAHPGGEVLALSSAGDVILVTTSQRKVVAYSLNGLRLWSRTMPELVLATPTDDGDGTIMVVGLDGSMLHMTSGTGHVLWAHKLAADVSSPAVIAGTIAIVTDRAGTRTAFNLRDGKVVWSQGGSPTDAALTFGERVLLAGDDGAIRAVDSASGKTLWIVHYQGNMRSAVTVGNDAVFATDEKTMSLDPSNGVVQWSRDAAGEAIGDGHHLVLVDGSSATLVGNDGSDAAHWNFPAQTTVQNQYVLAGLNGFVDFRSSAPATLVGAP